MAKLFRIVISGGPSGGKSTSLSYISDRLKSLGFNVYIVPEAATMMILNGIIPSSEPTSLAHFQTLLLKLQLNHEQIFTEAARASNKDSVILMDRGTMDGAAFTEPYLWQAILDENNWTTVGLRDKHYDAVIHLVTAAIGAEEYYTLANNAARSETPKQAALIDNKLKEAWLGHSHFRVIDNSTDFDGKLKRILSCVCNIVGAPEPLEQERKFLVKSFNFPDNFPTQKIYIKQTYLKSQSSNVARVRMRGQNNSFTYTHTIKKNLAPGKNIETEEIISGRDYLNLLKETDHSLAPIEKTRWCFLWKDQYFELDEFIRPENLKVLELETDNLYAEIELPSFVEIEREVTEDSEFSNYRLASKISPA